MKSGLAEIIWKTGSRFRNPRFEKHYSFLKNSECYSYEDLLKLQYESVRSLLVFANENSLFYKKKFSYASFNPERDFRSLEDLKKIPVTTKKELIDFNETIHTPLNRNSKVFLSETSGTTGQSLKFLKDENWDSFNRAARARGFSWNGVNIWERNGYLWGYDFYPARKFKTMLFDKIQNRFRLFSYSDEEIERFAGKLVNAEYLCGYSSMIYEIAKRINLNPKIKKPLNLKMVCGTSEKIFDSYQHEALKAYGKRIIGEYGAAEAGIIGFECQHGNLHINMEGVIVEEEKEEIVVTNLVAGSFPVIRYRLGDYIRLKDPSYECKCGMKHRIIEDVLGRVGKSIYGKEKKYPSLTFYYVFKNLAINNNVELNYQAEQKEKGKVTIRIQQLISPTEELMLNKELEKYFGNDVIFEIRSGVALRGKNEKFRDFISELE